MGRETSEREEKEAETEKVLCQGRQDPDLRTTASTAAKLDTGM